jgi:hypothetical protein
MFFMRIIIVNLSLFLLAFNSLLFAQSPSATWPFTNIARPNCSSMSPANTTCTKWPVKDGRWDESSTWNNGIIPGHLDIVCIPAGRVVTVKNPTYTPLTTCPATNTAASPQCFIFVCGTLDFDASGKLHLGCNSSLSVLPGGTVSPSNGNSDLIQIGTTVVWRDNNTTLTGPACICNGCPPNNVGCSFSAPLPAQLVSFNAKQENQFRIVLSWSTLQEINMKKINVEKSYNGTTWQPIGEVSPKGSANEQSKYVYHDDKPSEGLNYYRLKNSDQDGHFEYSNVVQVNFKESVSNFSVYPNPAKDKISIYTKGVIGQDIQIQLFQKNGILIQHKIMQSGNVQTMNISDLSNGIYFIRILDANGNTVHTQSVIKN